MHDPIQPQGRSEKQRAWNIWWAHYHDLYRDGDPGSLSFLFLLFLKEFIYPFQREGEERGEAEGEGEVDSVPRAKPDMGLDLRTLRSQPVPKLTDTHLTETLGTTPGSLSVWRLLLLEPHWQRIEWMWQTVLEGDMDRLDLQPCKADSSLDWIFLIEWNLNLE